MNNDTTKVEFLLSLSGNIICQRFFNVKDFNHNAKRSLDIKQDVVNICEEISNDLKEKTLDFLNSNQNYYPVLEPGDNSEVEEEEYFLLELKLNDAVFIQRIFAAHVFPPKVRYSVDIRPKLRRILNNLSETLSYDDVTTNYMSYELAK
jgi:hypothetical protein